MSITAKGPPYFTPTWEMVEPLVHKPVIPEVEERHRREVNPTMEQLGKLVGGEKLEWKRSDVEQATRDWWLDSEFADGTSVRDTLEKTEEGGNNKLYESVKETTSGERKPPYEPHDAGLKRTLRDLLGDGDWDHVRVYEDGRTEEGTSQVEWVTANQPVFYAKPKPVESETRTEQVGGTHYSEMAIQPWDAMRAWFTPAEYASYHIGSVIGYLSRHRKKGGLSDIKKAHHHLSELIRYFEKEEEYE